MSNVHGTSAPTVRGPAEPKQNGHKSDRLLNAAGGGSLGTQAFSDIR
ncbi:MAG: hypothetical protein ACK6D6_00680 [Planctomyces sp.]|jgi:hypothetical protein